MEELLERVAGVDIGRRELRVCVRVPDEVSGEPTEIIESWATTTPDLLNLVVRLRGLGVTHVAMESTGVYWKALYYLCEAISRCCWSTPRTSSTCQGVRPTC